MRTTPALKNNIHIKVVPPDICLFFHETGYEVLHGEAICLIAPLINGRNSFSKIVDKLNNKLTAFDLECILLILEDEGFLKTSNDEYNLPINAFLDLFMITATALKNEIGKSKVSVKSFGVSSAPFLSILENVGINISKKPALTVVLVNDYLCEELRDFNKHAIRKDLRWLLMKPTGQSIWFGPTFFPGSPCWECVAHRLSENLRAQTFSDTLEPLKFKVQRPTRPVLHLAAIETIKNLAHRKLESLTLQTLDLKNMKLESHSIFRSDQCTQCTKHRKNNSPKITLRNSTPVVPELTFRKYQHLISPITGILDQLTTESRGPLFFSTVKHPFLLPSKKHYPSKLRLKRYSIGKGLTPEQSATGAICEALERYSGIFRGDESRIKASHKELNKDAIHPNRLMNFSDSQYFNRDELNESGSDHDWIPVQFNEDRKIEWSPIWSLTSRNLKYVPTAYCYYKYQLKVEERFCSADSNGNASGSTLEEAILHGFLEVVERDAVALWWFNQISRPALHLESLALPYITQLREHYENSSRTIFLFDITSDFGIPVFAAVSSLNDGSGFIFGFAASFDPMDAASKAIAEMNQFLGTEGKHLESLKFLQPDAPTSNQKHFRKRKSTNILQDIKTCVKLAEDRGMETLVLNQTRYDIGLPVVKVIVPGMRQFWARFAKGRLYDVPKQLGWVKTALYEDQLNPNRL